jgi:predicted phosphate transport protein (TIGR00153 family)
MFGRFMPTEGKFFDLFNEHAAQIVLAAHEMSALMAHFDEAEGRTNSIDRIEKEGDRVTHRTIESLHLTFITPIDRDQIHKLITTMDDILDLLQDTAQSIYLYDIREITPEAGRLADVCLECAERVQEAVKQLASMKNAQSIMALCADIDRLESDADHLMRTGIAKLFREEADTRQLIKMRSIYELLETVTDRCEDVANIIEGIVLENS